MNDNEKHMYRKIGRFLAISWRTARFWRNVKGAVAASPFLASGIVVLYFIVTNTMRLWALAAILLLAAAMLLAGGLVKYRALSQK